MVKRFLELSDKDLMDNPNIYSEEQLIYTLQNDCPSLRILNRYQKLSPYICAKYVIFGGNNEEYGDCSEDRWLCDYDILRKQTHITRQELTNAHIFVKKEEEQEQNELKLMELEDKNHI